MPLNIPRVDESDGVLDELQAWFLGQAQRDSWVYTAVLRQLTNRMYRDRDYLQKRQHQGRSTAYDYAVERDQKALAWAIQALVRYVPDAEKLKPEPARPPRKPARHLTPAQRETFKGKPSWNHRPKRDWAGAELPPVGQMPTPSDEENE